MVSFRNLATAALVAAAPVMGALTSHEIVTALEDLTIKAQALQSPAQKVTIINGPLIVVGLGPFPQIITGFHEIITTAGTNVLELAETSTLTDADDRGAIADAFRDFVRVNQVLLSILTGKAGLFRTLPVVGHPVVATLRQLDAVYGSTAFALIDIVSDQDGLHEDAASLRSTLDNAIKSYEGLQFTKGYEGLQFTKRENVIPAAALKAAPIGRRAKMIAA